MDEERSEKTGNGGEEEVRGGQRRIKEEERKYVSQRAEHSTEAATGKHQDTISVFIYRH